MADYPQNVLDALDATLNAYDRLIADVEGGMASWWETYGDSCRLCTAVIDNVGLDRWSEKDGCKDECPIYVTFCGGDVGLRDALDDKNPEEIKLAAIARRAWIVAESRKNGVTLPEEDK